LPMIDHLLQASGVSLAQLDGIAFGCGPGSFTGLRVACAVAKGLGFAHDLPLYPVSDLQAIAAALCQHEVIPEEAVLLSMMDARMQQVYWSLYDHTLQQQVPQQVSAVADIQLAGDQPIALIGVGVATFNMQLPPALQARIFLQQTIHPHARDLLLVVQKGLAQACAAGDALPAYVRNDVVYSVAANQAGGLCG